MACYATWATSAANQSCPQLRGRSAQSNPTTASDWPLANIAPQTATCESLCLNTRFRSQLGTDQSTVAEEEAASAESQLRLLRTRAPGSFHAARETDAFTTGRVLGFAVRQTLHVFSHRPDGRPARCPFLSCARSTAEERSDTPKSREHAAHQAFLGKPVASDHIEQAPMLCNVQQLRLVVLHQLQIVLSHRFSFA